MPNLWGGRFSIPTDQLVSLLNNSIPFDWRLAPYDIRGSTAWARSLQKAGILSEEEARRIVGGLTSIQNEVSENTFNISPQDEDVHSAIERRLGEMIGPLAGKLHTGRSRNDQVMADFNLWMKDSINLLAQYLKGLQNSLLNRAKRDHNVILPGYTHFQRAQPVLLSHWWLSHFWPLERDLLNLAHSYRLADVLPLGSGALAGTPFAIDRLALAKDLDFSTISLNSIDAVANRDAAISFLFFCTANSIHLSRLAEALILFSTAEFGFIELSDAYSTGSSLMPQKKNPDPLELIRAKSGPMLGRLTGLFAVLKGLPSAYDKDLQEDKPAVFGAADTVSVLLPVMTGILDTLTVNSTRMRMAIDPAMLATELADYLVIKGVPFREAHHVVGQIVAYSISIDQPIDTFSLEQFKNFHPSITQDVATVFDPRTAIEKRSLIGGTSPDSITHQIRLAEDALSEAFIPSYTTHIIDFEL